MDAGLPNYHPRIAVKVLEVYAASTYGFRKNFVSSLSRPSMLQRRRRNVDRQTSKYSTGVFSLRCAAAVLFWLTFGPSEVCLHPFVG
jgi:hypothetical protein